MRDLIVTELVRIENSGDLKLSPAVSSKLDAMLLGYLFNNSGRVIQVAVDELAAAGYQVILGKMWSDYAIMTKLGVITFNEEV